MNCSPPDAARRPGTHSLTNLILLWRFHTMDPDAGTCPICLDPLSQTGTDGQTVPFGTTVPCGHCLHVDCWNEYAQSRRDRARPCPVCKTPSSFQRVFLDLGCLGIDDDDDDDESACSLESQAAAATDSIIPTADTQNAISADAHNNKNKNTSLPSTANPSEPIDTTIPPPVIDLSTTPPPPRDYDKYRRRAKRYRRHNSRLEHQTTALTAQLRTARDEQVQLKQEIERLHATEQHNDALVRQIAQLTHTKQTLQHSHTTLTQSHQAQSTRIQTLQADLRRLREQFQSHNERQMTEVRRIVADYPVLQQERDRLQRELQQLRHDPPRRDDDRRQNNNNNKGQPLNRSSVKRILETMNNNRQTDTKRRHSTKPVVVPTKASSHAVRIMKKARTETAVTQLSIVGPKGRKRIGRWRK